MAQSTERTFSVTFQNKFLSGNTRINLDQVVDMIEPPEIGSLRADEVWMMVMMEDGTFNTIKGRAATEAFRQAMDHYLGADLF